MPRLPLLSHQQLSDQSTLAQQMFGLCFRRYGEPGSGNWQACRPSPSPYKAPWRRMCDNHDNGTLPIRGMPIRGMSHWVCTTFEAGGSSSAAQQGVPTACRAGSWGKAGAPLAGSTHGHVLAQPQGSRWREPSFCTEQLRGNTASWDLQRCAGLCPSAVGRQSQKRACNPTAPAAGSGTARRPAPGCTVTTSTRRV